MRFQYLQSGLRPERFGKAAVRLGTGGGSPVVPQAVIMPTPPFGSANLLNWIDVRKSYTDWTGLQQSSAFIDSVGHQSFGYIEDLAGVAGWLQFDKSLQPGVGPNGGILLDGTGYMDCMSLGLLNGIGKLSRYMYARPLAGTAKRTAFFASESPSTVAPVSVTVAAGGSGYAAGDFITAQSILKVLAVDGGGAVTSVEIAVFTNTASPPANPVAQTAVSRPNSTSPGTGATFNYVFPLVGSGTGAARFSDDIVSGSTTRKQAPSTCVGDGTAIVSGNSTTSLGAPNNAALTDTTTIHRLGAEFDFGTGVVNYFYDGVADGSASCASGGVFNIGDSAIIRLGANGSAGSPALMEIIAYVLIADTLDASRRAAMDAYLLSGV